MYIRCIFHALRSCRELFFLNKKPCKIKYGTGKQDCIRDAEAAQDAETRTVQKKGEKDDAISEGFFVGRSHRSQSVRRRI